MKKDFAAEAAVFASRALTRIEQRRFDLSVSILINAME